jgi:hypothetical protein
VIHLYKQNNFPLKIEWLIYSSMLDKHMLTLKDTGEGLIYINKLVFKTSEISVRDINNKKYS